MQLALALVAVTEHKIETEVHEPDAEGGGAPCEDHDLDPREGHREDPKECRELGDQDHGLTEGRDKEGRDKEGQDKEGQDKEGQDKEGHGEQERAAAASIRIVTGFKNLPKFYDVGPLLQDAALVAWCTAAMAWRVRGFAPTHVAGVDARGFIFGPLVAMHLGLPFVMVRKRGKLPDEAAVSGAYAKEYAQVDGPEQLAVQAGVVGPGHRVVVVDDVVATGSTLVAAENVLMQLGATVVAHACVVHMVALGAGTRVHAPIFAAVPQLGC